MNRKPITHEKAKGFRLCSMPNGLWQLQHFVPLNNNAGDDKMYDPWKGVNRPTTFEEAKRQLGTKLPSGAKL